MTLQHDPPRLIELEASADPLLREALRLAASDAPTARQLEALALEVAAVTAAGAAAGAAGSQLDKLSWLGGKAGMAKLALVLVCGGSAAWLGARLFATEDPTLDRGAVSQPARAQRASPAAQQANAAHEKPAQALPAPKSADHAALPAPSAARVRPPPSAASAEPAPHAASSTAPRVPAAQRKPVSQAPSAARAAAAEPQAVAERNVHAASTRAPEQTPVASELELLGRAQGLLTRDPASALAVTDEHARAYPRGTFAQEREALAIDALHRLGRRREMEARARAFLQRYPDSPHRERIDSWLR
jgi:hypothetical protein